MKFSFVFIGLLIVSLLNASTPDGFTLHLGVHGRHTGLDDVVESNERGTADQVNYTIYNFHRDVLPWDLTVGPK